MTSKRFIAPSTKYDPFPWQIRLAKEVAENGWGGQRSIRLPTASGKTSLLDIAVFALAVQVGRPLGERTVPLRTFFVVDRRLVVDDVTRHAERLAEVLNAESEDELKEVRENLSKFKSEFRLLVSTLRGGMYRSGAWADSPSQPLICVSTVDQAGSRLLFRGYGTSCKRRSVDAGLIGCDSLIILDEAHLSGPFVETMEAVQKYGDWAEQKQLFRALRFVQMSATSRDRNSFALDKDDYENETLAKRLNARKTTRLREVANLEQEAAGEARELAARPGISIVGVVVNTVSAARAIFEQVKGDTEDERAVLLTGRTRPYDRDELLKRFLGRMKAGRDREADTPLYVVATQTIEVGADLDFDALVSEAAPLDALRQRFGRLDRLGELGDSQAVILRRKLARGETDRVYGDAVEKTWEWLDGQAEGKAGEKSIDFGARRMQELYDAHGDPELNAKTDHSPLVTPAHIETWIQTYPTPDPDPDLDPFLHGKDASGADVNLVWRADFEDLDVTEWDEVLDIAAPLPTEALPIPIWVAVKWLKRQTAGNPADVEGSRGETEEESPGDEAQHRDFLIWRGSDDNQRRKIELVRPGDTLILRSSEGGADKFGWKPDSTHPVRDIGNECSCERARQAGGRCVVRAHPALWFAENAEEQEAIQEALEMNLRLWKEEGDDEGKDAILEIIEQCYPEFDWMERSDRAGNLYFTTKWLKPQARSANNLADETEEDDSASFTVPVPLKEHVKGVVEHVKSFAIASGVGDELANALETAAALHDLGKCDMRFQTLLGAATDDGLDGMLAKSEGGVSKMERDRRRRVAGYPPNARHELWSVALAEKSELISDSALRDLILHLIGTHHGYGRPFAPVWEEQESVEVVSANGELLKANGKNVRDLWSLGSGWVDRFARLNRAYGYWGLAYLEAILRRADCVQSREEQEANQ